MSPEHNNEATRLPHSFWWLLTGDTGSTLDASIYTLVILYIVQKYSSNVLLSGFVRALSRLPPILAGIGRRISGSDVS